MIKDGKITNLVPTQQPHRRGPNAAQRVVNYGKAVVRYRKNYGYIIPLEMADERTSKCHSNVCGMYNKELDRCLHRKCGCTVKDKATWSTESCPKGLWGVIFGPAPKEEK